jgi:hypothetical protein
MMTILLTELKLRSVQLRVCNAAILKQKQLFTVDLNVVATESGKKETYKEKAECHRGIECYHLRQDTSL